ncbi:FAD:protein FMN transferase [Pusillimonas sp.]|uniref:FAD:protein FMN transferase n=1 Tax=Pusillimonas sp. TaxID=3040095 RepID=UPI0037C7657E
MTNAGVAAPAYASLAGASMGTTWTVKFNAQGVDLPRLKHGIPAALDEIVAQMSTWDDDSAISSLNRAEPGWYQLPAAFFKVLAQALKLAETTDGAYDPTVGALVDLWGFGSKGALDSPPPAAAVADALAHCGWRRTALDAEHCAVWQPGGMHFDLSSIAKGYGVDVIGRVLEEAGVTDYLAELGGELKAGGLNPARKPWALDIETPVPNPERVPIVLNNLAIATSGDYRRYFIHQGRRYAHTIDPRLGAPISGKLASVSVIHPHCMMADGLATALLALGSDKGMAYAQRHNIAALFMSRHEHDVAIAWSDEFAKCAGADTSSPCS